MANRRQVIRQNISAGPPRRPNLAQNRPAPAGPLAGNKAVGGPGQGAAPQGAQAPPPQAPMPWDVGAANSEAAALTKRNNAVTGLGASWLRTQQDFGLEGPWADPASNPYSRAALLQRSYNNAKRGTTNSAGRRLYAGSFINAQNQNTHQFNLGRDELQKGYAEAQAQNVSERQRADDEYRESLVQANWDRINAGLESEPEPMPGGAPQGGKKPQSKRQFQIRQNINQKPKKRR